MIRALVAWGQGKIIFVSTMTAAAVVTAFGLAPPSHADDDPDSDAIFSNGLANQGLEFNFPLEKYQGQRYCRSVMDGKSPIDAIHDLMRNGEYSFDVANGITSSAMVAYCECAVLAADGLHADPSLCRPFELAYRRGN